MEALEHALQVLVDEHAMGMYFDRDSDTYVVRTSSRDRAGFPLDAVPQRLNVVVAPSRLDNAEIERFRSHVKSLSWHPDARSYSYTFDYDARTDKVLLESDAPDNVIAPLLTMMSDTVNCTRVPPFGNLPAR